MASEGWIQGLSRASVVSLDPTQQATNSTIGLSDVASKAEVELMQAPNKRNFPLESES